MELSQNRFLPGHKNGNEVSPEQPAMTQAMIHLVQSVSATIPMGSMQFLFCLSNRSCNEKPAYIQRDHFLYILIHAILFLYRSWLMYVHVYTYIERRINTIKRVSYKTKFWLEWDQTPWNWWDDNIKTIISETGCENVNWIKTIQNSIQQGGTVTTTNFHNSREFLCQVNKYQLLRDLRHKSGTTN